MDSSEILNALSTAFSVLFKGKNFVRLLGGLGVTIWIAALSVALSLVLGFFVWYCYEYKEPRCKSSLRNLS